MRPLVIILALLLVAVGALVGIRLGSSPSSAATPREILLRSETAMEAVHTVRVTGAEWEREIDPFDLHSSGSWEVQGECTTQVDGTVSRFSYRGSQTGLHAKAVDEQLVVRVPPVGATFSPSLRWTVWRRTLHPLGSWHLTGLTHDAQLVTSMCPSLITPTELRVSTPFKDVGRLRIGGREVIHLVTSIEGHGGGDATELFVDAHSYRWLQVRLSGWGPGCCHAYRTTFDYSSFNVPASIKFPLHRPVSRKQLRGVLLPCPPLQRTGIQGKGVIDPRIHGAPTTLSSLFVVTREWADVRSNLDLIVYGGYLLRPPHRGFIAVFQFNQCTGAHRPEGIFMAPSRIGVPVLEPVRGNLVHFRAGKRQGSFNLLSHIWKIDRFSP